MLQDCEITKENCLLIQKIALRQKSISDQWRYWPPNLGSLGIYNVLITVQIIEVNNQIRPHHTYLVITVYRNLKAEVYLLS